MKKKTSEEWNKLIPYIKILNPDGWDRKNYNYSWKEELITFDEFEKRLLYSTLIMNDNIPSLRDLECCKDCGCTSIETAAWVDVNSGIVQGEVSSIDTYFCNKCQKHFPLDNITIFQDYLDEKEIT